MITLTGPTRIGKSRFALCSPEERALLSGRRVSEGYDHEPRGLRMGGGILWTARASGAVARHLALRYSKNLGFMPMSLGT